jgi:hypothetical protein
MHFYFHSHQYHKLVSEALFQFPDIQVSWSLWLLCRLKYIFLLFVFTVLMAHKLQHFYIQHFICLDYSLELKSFVRADNKSVQAQTKV